MTYQGHPDQNFGCETYSQNGEDLVILNIFYQLGINKPSYLDLGAHHPFNISNTALLYKRGSRGVNVDANANLIDQFHWDRPHDRNVCVGVSAPTRADGGMFYMFDERSGRNSMDIEEVKSFSAESGMKVSEVKSIKIMTINEIVEKYCDGKFPDFLSVDLEGWDFEVLMYADFTKLGRPKVVCVESRPGADQTMTTMMFSNYFFRFIRMGDNLIFVSKDAWLAVHR